MKSEVAKEIENTMRSYEEGLEGAIELRKKIMECCLSSKYSDDQILGALFTVIDALAKSDDRLEKNIRHLMDLHFNDQ
jgi:rRNA-processing protein FCF1